ncbi:glycosyltransferase family 2 protein [Rhizobium sp. R86522]|uniref:glycosyltransferase family 2 protein n=1 Tax=Rhizobium sp. R86522 TaxID=3093861 RepID=UPI003671C761
MAPDVRVRAGHSVTVSIVSHRHGEMVGNLVRQLLNFPLVERILVTHNVVEEAHVPTDSRVTEIWNSVPIGFGENHNTAFKQCQSEYFCVLNPDIGFLEDPFPCLLETITSWDGAMVAPRIVNRNGQTEDSARHFPTLSRILAKLVGISDGRELRVFGDKPFCPQCVAGMFMLFKSQEFSALRGFDAHYFLYYEDMDICVRLWKLKKRIVLDPRTPVIHDAQRQSHKSLRFLSWHLASMLRFLLRYQWRLPKVGPWSCSDPQKLDRS